MARSAHSPQRSPRYRRLLRALIVLMISLSLAVGAFLIYTSIDYEAHDTAVAMLREPSVETVSDDLIILHPEKPSTTALIFYPGAKVEYTAYLPLLGQIAASSDLTIFLAEMPFNMAIFSANRASDIMEDYPDFKDWYIAGHSMGGAMASSFAAKHPDEVAGLILLGAYIYGDVDPADALTIYGTLNTSVAERVDPSGQVVAIEGGNHAQFGNYGEQRGDAPASISAEEQQRIAAEAIVAFIEARGD